MSHRTNRYLLWGVFAVALAGILAAAFWTGPSRGPRLGGWDQKPLEGLGRFGTVPDFSLVERSGRTIQLSDLKDKIWVVNFIYTSCKDSCPLQSAEMAKLQSDLEDRKEVRLLSISVDPERDTPEVLSAYAERFRADPERWLFLTGKKDEIYRLAQQGFRLSAVPASQVGQKSAEILHSPRFVLVDDRAEIRGYYDSNDPEALRRARQDVRRLLRERMA
jgi:protein SCO1/2